MNYTAKGRLPEIATTIIDMTMQTEVTLCKVEEAEGDEMWRFLGNKSQQHWLWHAIDHNSGKILTYVFGGRFEFGAANT